MNRILLALLIALAVLGSVLLLHKRPSQPHLEAVSQDGTFRATVQTDAHTISIWNIHTCRQIDTFTYAGQLLSIRFVEDETGLTLQYVIKNSSGSWIRILPKSGEGPYV